MRRTKRGGWPYSQPPNVPFTLNKDSPQAKGLVGWWPTLASCGANELRDLSVQHGNPLLPYGTPTRVTDSEFGTVVQCSASPWKHWYISDSDFVGFYGDTYCEIAVWVYLNSVPDSYDVAYLSSQTAFENAGFSLRVKNWGGAGIYFSFEVRKADDSGNVAVNSAAGVVTNKWYLVHGHHDPVANQIGIVVNGSMPVTNAITGGFRHSSQAFRIGSGPTAAKTLDGQFAGAHLWKNRILTPAARWQLYDPATRWELYKPLLRRVWVKSLAAAARRIFITHT